VLSAVIAALGVITIVGSGGGGGELDTLWVPDIDMPPYVTVTPSRLTVEQGGTAVFTANAGGALSAPTYQWRRDGATIAGATGMTYTLVGANLGDDGAQFAVEVTASNGTATATGLLQVSRLPGVVYEDSDFPLSNWTVAAIADPAQNGPSQTASRAATGGNPDAYRSIVYEMPAGVSSITVFHAAVPATYEPATQGLIYGIDAEMDCKNLTGAGEVSVRALLEQAGRRFATEYRVVCISGWEKFSVLSRRADDFMLVDGPACATTEACPDFSASGAPIRLGFWTRSRGGSSASPAGTVSQGIDNWKVTVWRK
jgi:hypothetical protein